MKASEQVAQLVALIAEHGDLEIVYENYDSRFSPSIEFEAGFESSEGLASAFLVNLGG